MAPLALVLYVVPGSLGLVSFDAPQLGGPMERWWLLAAIGYLATLIPLLIARATVLPVTDRPDRPWTAVGVFVVVSYLRLAVVIPAGVALDLIPPEQIAFRLWTAIPYMTISLIVTSAIASQLSEFIDRTRDLLRAEFELRQLRARSAELARRDREQLQQSALAVLRPALTQFLSDLAAADQNSQVRAMVPSAHALVDDVVRPLVLDMASAAYPDIPVVAPTWRFVRDGFQLFRARLEQLMHPTLTVALVAYCWLAPASVERISLEAVWGLVPAAVLMWSCVTVVRRVLAPLQVSFWSGSLLVSLVYLAVGALAGWVATLWVAHIDNFAWSFALTSQFVGWGMFLYSFTGAQADTLAMRARRIREQAEQTEQGLRQQWRWNRKRIAAALHGPVQAALQSSAIRLRQADMLAPELRESIRASMIDAVQTVMRAEPETPHDLERALQSLAEMWGHSSDVSWQLPPEVIAALQTDEVCCAAVTEVTTEAVLNAIKHGAAEQVRVGFELEPGVAVVVTVDGDGRLTNQQKPGYGSTVFDELTWNWSITERDDRTVFRARVALQPPSMTGSRHEVSQMFGYPNIS